MIGDWHTGTPWTGCCGNLPGVRAADERGLSAVISAAVDRHRKQCPRWKGMAKRHQGEAPAPQGVAG